MKHSTIQAVCLVVLAFITVLPSYAQSRGNADLTSIILEDFSGKTTHEWEEGRYHRSYDFSWALGASKFATKASGDGGVDYPISAHVAAWPFTLFGYNREGRELKSFGIHGRFDRRGYNWIDIYPVELDGETPFEIPLPGRVRYMELWVWGSNFNFSMEAYVRDYQGTIHLINLGSLNYAGWVALGANIPSYIQQGRRTLPNMAQMRFVKFRIWTHPSENVSDFYIYLNQFKILTNNLEAQFDGDELSDPDYMPQLWATN